MAQASFAYEMFIVRERELFSFIARKLNEQQAKFDRLSLQTAFGKWTDSATQLRKVAMEEEQKQQVINVLKTSSRGARSTMEKEILRRFIVSNLTCIPKSITFSEMDQLCNELDWYPLEGRSIVFLQGDFGNVYYMIACGTVGLYLEPSKDREMIVAREYGRLRAQPFPGSDEELKGLGNNIFNLPKGSGFGEYAILATTNKIRSCAAVALAPDSLLLIMQAETYNNVLRVHHYRQKQLSSATSLLSELPLFKHHNYSKVASIAYTMRSQTYSSGSTIAKYDSVINNVMLVASGQVKVYAAPTISTDDSPMIKAIQRRIPKLAVAMLGRGQVIGEIEIHNGSRTFQMTYESAAATTEVLEMPATIFKESIGNIEFRSTALSRAMENVNDEKTATRAGRVNRAYDAMRKMMEGPTKDTQTKEQLMNILPSILDPTLTSTTKGSFNVANNSSKLRRPSMLTNNSHTVTEDAPKVTRRASYDPTGNNIKSPRLSNNGKSIDIQAAIREAQQAASSTNGVTVVAGGQQAHAPFSPRKSSYSNNQAPTSGSRKLSFVAK